MQVRKEDGVILYNEIQLNSARYAIQGLQPGEVDAALTKYAQTAFAPELAGAARTGASLEATVAAMTR